MSSHNYKFHFLSSDVPDSLLIQFRYPIKERCRNSQNGTFVGFQGLKETDLESEFDAYLITPLSYFNSKSKNLTCDEFKVITLTEGASDLTGFIEVQE